ncbi:amidohydrolase [Rhodobacterales bacterium HKCCE2091]|nr:amidohydrolase [Rhodobacterales bacterium HKCCE2091]
MRIAAAAYPLDPLTGWPDYENKLSAWVAEAAGQGAELLVFPEYGAMELAHLDGPEAAGDLQRCLRSVARHFPRADELHDRLARAHGVHILAASGPVFEGAAPVNRARLFGPDGPLGHQDKQVMTRFERDWGVVPGGPLRTFDVSGVRIGVLICYDAEFPLLGRALSDDGVEVVLTPSCTDSVAGFTRVRVGAMARALEAQCVVVHSPTVGVAEWCPAVDENRGRAAIYGPPDLGFPETGVIAEGAMDAPGWTFADIDPAAIARVRAEGRVLNRAHWPESAARAVVRDD